LPDPRYAFISAYLKGEEARLVTSEYIDRISKVSEISDVLGIIKETDIGSYLEEAPAENFGDIDERLWTYFRDRLSQIEWFRLCPPDILKLLRAYIIKYDVLNIKAALQSILTGKKARMIPMGVIHNCGLLDKLSSAENLDDIVELLTKCKLQDYVPALKEYEISEGANPGFLAETKLDNEYYKNMLNIAKGIKDGSVLSKALGLAIDLTNLQVALRAIIGDIGPDAAEYAIAGGYVITDKVIRDLLAFKLTDMPQRLENTQYGALAKEILSSYETTKNITVVDEIIDKHKFRLLKEILAPRVLSPLVMAWYLILKEVEIRNLRLILKAIVDGVPVEETKDYLVL